MRTVDRGSKADSETGAGRKRREGGNLGESLEIFRLWIIFSSESIGIGLMFSFELVGSEVGRPIHINTLKRMTVP